jgi:MFS transporter, DHA2 family, multidrug resistance protein
VRRLTSSMKVNFTKHRRGVLRGLQDKESWNTNIRPLIGLLGVLVAALSADLNEFVSGAALIDYRGALGISADPGRWIDSLYVTGTALGMAFAPWSAVTFTLRRFTLFAIGLACAATTLLAVAPNLQAIMTFG